MGHAIDNFNWTGCHIHPKQTEKTNNQVSTTRKGKLDLDNRLGHSISCDEVNNVKITLLTFKLNENVFAPSFQILSGPLHLLLLYTTTVTTIIRLYLAHFFIVQMVS